MKKRWLLAGSLLSGVLLWIVVGTDRHPDTSTVAPFAPYTDDRDDIAPSWSLDDSRIVYCRASTNGAMLYEVPAAGGPTNPFPVGASGGCTPAWSPDGARVAFSSDRSGHFQLMRALGLARPINIWTVNADGEDLRQVTDSRTNALDPSWSRDGTQIAFTTFPGPRAMSVPAQGGEASLVAPGMSPAWSPDGKTVAFLSDTSGGSGARFSIAVQPAMGGAVKHLAGYDLKSSFFFRPSLDWSPDGERLLTVQLEDGQWQPVVINVNEDRIERTLPTIGSAIHPRWSHDGTRIVYGLTDTAHPPRIEVLALANGQRTSLTQGSRYTAAQLIRYKSAGNLEIPGWLYLPRDSDVTKHPALVWLHGGSPGSSSMGNQCDRRIQYFVDQGFVVLAPNYRGSTGFGDELARFRYGDDMLPDIRAGVDYLKGLTQVDPAHVGVVGFSFGGYLALRSLVQDPEVFAAAVDFYGLSELVTLYEENVSIRPTLTELLGGTPDQRASAYRAASPINFVDRIKSPLLILHGTRDSAAPYSQSAGLAKALARAHKDYEFISYRFAGHGFSGKDDIDANQQALRFLSAHLKTSR